MVTNQILPCKGRGTICAANGGGVSPLTTGLIANRKNLIVMLMAIELILLAVNLNLVAFSAYLGDLVGQVFAMFVLTVAAGEAAIGLAILVIYFRGRGTISVDDVNRMKG
ncbi:NAD(P)H-quinone oxidoreductase subunit 4L, chloroplastic [subsurface metagenome]